MAMPSVKYQDLLLKAAYIDILLDSNIAYAVGIHDSNKIIGRPEFHQGAEVFHADQIRYNFKTKKGRINEIDTKEGEGYIHGNIVKKDSTNVYYIKNGRYTTCNEEKDPHFFIAALKLKVIPNNQVVTGPAMMYIEGVPTPLVIPFGFFPLTNGRHSGILIPTYGESQSQGFFLQNGGYYLGLNDHFGMQVRGDIYTNGSWGERDLIDYNDRYHYHGSFQFSMSETKLPIPESAGLSDQHNFLINWQHSQDVKANPYSTFCASVNAGTSDFLTTNSYNPALILQNTLQSNIAYTQNFPNSPFHIALNASHSQNTITQEINITLPEFSATMDRQYPFKAISSNPASTTNPLNNISFSGTMVAENTIAATQNALFTQQTLGRMQNGVNTSIPFTGNWQLFRISHP